VREKLLDAFDGMDAEIAGIRCSNARPWVVMP